MWCPGYSPGVRSSWHICIASRQRIRSSACFIRYTLLPCERAQAGGRRKPGEAFSDPPAIKTRSHLGRIENNLRTRCDSVILIVYGLQATAVVYYLIRMTLQKKDDDENPVFIVDFERSRSDRACLRVSLLLDIQHLRCPCRFSILLIVERHAPGISYVVTDY